MSPESESVYTQAQRHVRRGREIVSRQRELIAEIRVGQRDASLAEDLLQRFENSLAIFESDLADIERRQS
jgi:hypothetical protein